MNHIEYVLPTFWASALINGDYSGLEDTDVLALNNWLEKEQPGYCINCEDYGFTPFHDARSHVLACDCSVYYFFNGGLERCTTL